MKRYIAAILLMGWLVTPIVQASFKLPKSVYRISQMASAQKEAKEKNKAITILYSDENVGCPIQSRASEENMEAFDNRSILVYAYWKDDWDALPSQARDAINALAVKAIPVAIVMDNELQRVIATVPYRSEDDRKQAMKEARRALSGLQKNGSRPK